MKLSITFFLLVLLSGKSWSQQDSIKNQCYVLKVAKARGYNDSIKTTSYYNPNGFYVLTNGIYNFKIKGNKYKFYREVSISSDSLAIAFALNEKPIIKFRFSDIKNMRFKTLDNGRISWPSIIINSRKYIFSIVLQTHFCQVQTSYIVEGKDTNTYKDKDGNKFYRSYQGCQYMTAFGENTIYNKNGTYYMLGRRKIYKIK